MNDIICCFELCKLIVCNFAHYMLILRWSLLKTVQLAGMHRLGSSERFSLVTIIRTKVHQLSNFLKVFSKISHNFDLVLVYFSSS